MASYQIPHFKFSKLLCGLSLSVLFTCHTFAGTDVLYAIDFSSQPDGGASAWLQKVGFQNKLNADKLEQNFIDKRLVLETEDQIAGLFSYPLEIDDVRGVRITWGVNRYPEGADWNSGNYRVPIAAVISLGQEKVSSGAVFLPSAPYFISPFLSQNATEGRIYTAKYYRKSGRYVCKPCAPEVGRKITTTIDIEDIYKSEFMKGDVPSVSGFAFQVNTKNTQGGASAFIEKVEFLSTAPTE